MVVQLIHAPVTHKPMSPRLKCRRKCGRAAETIMRMAETVCQKASAEGGRKAAPAPNAILIVQDGAGAEEYPANVSEGIPAISCFAVVNVTSLFLHARKGEARVRIRKAAFCRCGWIASIAAECSGAVFNSTGGRPNFLLSSDSETWDRQAHNRTPSGSCPEWYSFEFSRLRRQVLASGRRRTMIRFTRPA